LEAASRFTSGEESERQEAEGGEGTGRGPVGAEKWALHLMASMNGGSISTHPSADEEKNFNSRALFSSPEIQKVFKILCHIEFCGICMKH